MFVFTPRCCAQKRLVTTYCFYNYKASPTVPPSVWLNPSRLKQVKDEREKRARANGAQPAQLTAPSQDKIDAFKKRISEKGNRRKTSSEAAALNFNPLDLVDVSDASWGAFSEVHAPFVERHEPARIGDSGAGEASGEGADTGTPNQGTTGSGTHSPIRPRVILPAVPLHPTLQRPNMGQMAQANPTVSSTPSCASKRPASFAK